MRSKVQAIPTAIALPFGAAVVLSCAHGATPSLRDARDAVRTGGAHAAADPTVHGARVVPESFDEDHALGTEPGGGLRSLAFGVRVVSLPDGAVLASPDKLPGIPQATIALPERLGGGFLFVLSNVVWRSDRWLSPATPIFASSSAITRVLPGLDRVYVRTQNGAFAAFDGTTGARAPDLGPWPGSSFVGGYAAIDGWRAVAVNDLRGVVATFDAGATWRPLGLPIDPKETHVDGDAAVVSGVGGAYEIRGDGHVIRLAATPSSPPTVAARDPAGDRDRDRDRDRGGLGDAGRTFAGAVSSPLDPAHVFGRHPLLAAIEDGWPLDDGTAVVARDGALARIRIADGALVEVAGAAFAASSALCHPLPFARDGAGPGAFGFLCGEPRGATTIYAFDEATGRVLPFRRFARPRIVAAAGNGALVVHGPCAEDAVTGGADADDDTRHTYCLYQRKAWREIHVAGEVGGERVVALADGRVAIVSPPRGAHAPESARLTILDGNRAATVAVIFPEVSHEVGRMLRLGAWLDGFEERRPGVLGGWIEADGVMLGIEIDDTGKAHHGAYIRDAGAPMVSGRYGLGWGGARRGYETTDGGMTWTAIEVPDALTSSSSSSSATRAVAARACGPIGCSAAGWLRVGWGASSVAAPRDPPRAYVAKAPRAHQLALTCTATAAIAPGGPLVSTAPADPFRAAPWRRVTLISAADLAPFFGVAPPPLRADDRALTLDVLDTDGRTHGLLARAYGWGPKGGDWGQEGRWLVRWISPFGGSNQVHSTTAAHAPNAVLAMVSGLGTAMPYGMGATWDLLVAEDPTHALLFSHRRMPLEPNLFELAADRAPIDVRRADGEPIGELESAVFAAGHWYLAVPATGDLPATTILRVDAGVAQELARIPRYVPEGKSAARLARSADGRAIGYVVDGQPGERGVPLRWVLPFDLDSGTIGDPAPLGAADLLDRPLTPCAGDEAGWVFDVPIDASALTTQLQIGGESVSSWTGQTGHIRASEGRACIERLALTTDASITPSVRAAGDKDELTVPVSVVVAGARWPLRCTIRDAR